MGVGSLHDCVVRPMLAADIREGVQLAEIVRNVVRVRLTAQQAVDDGHNLRAVDLVVSAEGAVAIAVDPAMLGGSLDVRGGPIAVAHIVEVLILLHDLSVAIAVHIKEADGQRGELGAGNGIVGGKDGLALTVGDTVVIEVFGITGVPGMGGNIRKSGVGHGGNGIAVLLRQQAGEDSGGLWSVTMTVT